MRATDKRRMTHTGQLDVVQELPYAAYHPLLCHTQMPLTQFRHAYSPPSSRFSPRPLKCLSPGKQLSISLLAGAIAVVRQGTKQPSAARLRWKSVCRTT
jgi:hypothetical protein